MCKINARGTYEVTLALVYLLTWRIHYEQELKKVDEKQRSLVEKQK